MMKQYDSYKDSGVQWIGKIPSHWEVCKLKSYCSLSGRIGWNGLRSEEFEEESYAYLVTGQDFIKADIDWNSCYQINKERYDEDPFIQLSNGDILITKDGTIGKIAKVSNLDKPACLNSGIFVMKQKREVFYQNFLYWLLVSNLLKDFNSYTSTGTTILHLYQNVFENMPIIVPSIEEQRRIAAYLDKKCGEIDKAIATQQKRIDLLVELRQNIITHAVTRGINPDAPLKDSGVDWIGKVPRHWVVCRLKNYCSLSGRIGWNGLRADEFKKESYAYLVTGQDFIKADINWESCYQIDKDRYDEDPFIQLKNGDLLITKDGTIGKIAKVSGLDKPACLNSGIFVLKQRKIVFEQNYLYWMLVSSLLKDYNSYTSSGTTILHLYQNVFENMPMIIPPMQEQNKIAEYIFDNCKKMDKSIAKAEQQIALLQELKQSIITEVVTGKRKVVA